MMQNVRAAENVRLGRFLSLVLRHRPAAAGISLDQNGWANVDELIAGVRKTGRKIDESILEEVVEGNDKKRYMFNEDRTKIRANQGHTIAVDIELREQLPPMPLYHGTASRLLGNIRSQGLLKQKRLHVHLSADIATAASVGRRHGKAVVLEIDTASMVRDGYRFCLSENNVWLCDSVPWKYITEHRNS